VNQKNFSELKKLDREMQSDQAQTKHHLTGDLSVPTNCQSKSTDSARIFGPPYIFADSVIDRHLHYLIRCIGWEKAKAANQKLIWNSANSEDVNLRRI
jgi:hypothetical protein